MGENKDTNCGTGTINNTASCTPLSPATSSSSSSVTKCIIQETNTHVDSEAPRLVLRLKKPEGKKKVGFTSETVDNEGMNKKKSKCCCIYEKPRVFGESSSESEDDCENCYGHGDHRSHRSDSPTPPSVPPI